MLVPCGLVLEWITLVFSVCRPLGVMETRRKVFDPLAWCGAVFNALCEERGDPHPSWRSTLVESEIKVIEKLCGRLRLSRKKLGGREAIHLVSDSTSWTGGDLMPTHTTG